MSFGQRLSLINRIQTICTLTSRALRLWKNMSEWYTYHRATGACGVRIYQKKWLRGEFFHSAMLSLVFNKGLWKETLCLTVFFFWMLFTYRSWGLHGPGAGCTGGPCLKWFHLYVHSIYLFELFTQCFSFFKFVGVQIQKPNYQM